MARSLLVIFSAVLLLSVLTIKGQDAILQDTIHEENIESDNLKDTETQDYEDSPIDKELTDLLEDIDHNGGETEPVVTDSDVEGLFDDEQLPLGGATDEHMADTDKDNDDKDSVDDVIKENVESPEINGHTGGDHQHKVSPDTQADYQDTVGAECTKITEDMEGNIICEQYETSPGSKYKKPGGGGPGAFAIIMAVLTAGVIFFLLGFFLHRFKGGSTKENDSSQQPLRMKPVYTPTPTEPPVEEVTFQQPTKKVPTPEIIYTNHDEPDLPASQPDVVLPPRQANKKQDLRKSMPPIGKYQSPVDIDPEEAELSDELMKNPLVFKYVPENTKSLTNLGSTVKVMVDCRGSDLHGGPLGDKRYCLDHFRFRWGAEDNRGSEHSVAEKRYAGEIQLLHWNKEDFRTYSEASRYESGLAGLSVFMEASNEEHTGLQVLLDVFKSIKYKGDSVEVPHHYFDPATLLPSNPLEYWTYPGSLTESPYNETVTWLVLREPIKVSSKQLEKFRCLMRCERDEEHGTPGNERLVDNFREQSALGDRSLRASFHLKT